MDFKNELLKFINKIKKLIFFFNNKTRDQTSNILLKKNFSPFEDSSLSFF